MLLQPLDEKNTIHVRPKQSRALSVIRHTWTNRGKQEAGSYKRGPVRFSADTPLADTLVKLEESKMPWHSVCTKRMPASDAVLRDKSRRWEDAVAPEWPRHIRIQVWEAKGPLYIKKKEGGDFHSHIYRVMGG